MNIEILYFEGCPTHGPTVELVNTIAKELGVSATVRNIDVQTEDDASALRFLGSPSVHVDGVDIDPGAVSRVDFGRRCRVYPSSDGLSGLPPRAWLEAALLGEPIAAEEVYEVSKLASCCPSANEGATYEVILLVADWCPRCPSAKVYWSDLSAELGFSLQTLDIASPKGMALAEQHAIRALPTALVHNIVLGAGVARPARAVILEALAEHHERSECE